jgi:hypothetical protein
MIGHRRDRSDNQGRLRRRLSQVTGLTLGIAMLGTIGLSGALAQDDNVAAGTDAESLVNAIIQQVFGEVFGGAMVADDAAVSGGGDINVGGNMGGSVTMGGSSGGGVTMGGGTSGGVTVGSGYGG